MIKAALAFLLVTTACGGDDGGTQTMIDAAGSGSAAACTGAVYETCVNNADCMSQNCHFYDQSAITVCTQVCDASNPCPNDSAGQPVACNTKGNCKPTVATTCTR